MRTIGLSVVLLGCAALGFIACEAIRGAVSAPANQAAERENVVASEQLIAWAAFVGVVVVLTLTSGLGGVAMSLRNRNTAGQPSDRDGETAARIDAEVNEGGPPSPIPCDTPAESSVCGEFHQAIDEEPTSIGACPSPDRILHLPLGEAIRGAKSTTLARYDGLELIRLVIPAGKEIPPHRVAGEITVQCIEGHVACEHDGHGIDLHAGDLLHLCPQEIHSLKGLADSSVLVTRLRPHANELPEQWPTH